MEENIQATARNVLVLSTVISRRLAFVLSRFPGYVSSLAALTRLYPGDTPCVRIRTLPSALAV